MPQRHKLTTVTSFPRRSTVDPQSADTRPRRAPKPPRWLSADAAKVWRETGRYMVEVGTWQPAFTTTLASFSVLEAMFRADTATFSAARMAQKRLLASDLGLAPATIARVAKLAPPRTNKFAEFSERTADSRDPRHVLRGSA